MDTVLVGAFNPKNHLESEIMMERKGLIKRLEKEDIPVVAVESAVDNSKINWPRDDYVFYDGKIYFRKDYENYADGGYVRANADYTIACEGVSEREVGEKIHANEERFARLVKLYGSKIFVVPHLDYSLNDNLRPHSDMVLLPVPGRKTVFIDKIYYAAHKKAMDNFAELFKLDIKTLSTDYENPSWPCNTLIMRNGKSDVAMTNSVNNGHLIEQLRALDIRVIAVPFSYNCRAGGSVNCSTNTIPSDRLDEIIHLYSQNKVTLPIEA